MIISDTYILIHKHFILFKNTLKLFYTSKTFKMFIRALKVYTSITKPFFKNMFVIFFYKSNNINIKNIKTEVNN